MTELNELSNPSRYKILIQIKKNRVLKRKTKYLNRNFDFVEDEKQALEFPDIQSAEDTLSTVLSSAHNETRPRIIIKYTSPTSENQINNII